MAISKLGKRRQVVIPKAICEQLSLEEGDYVEVDLRGGMVVIKPKVLVDADTVITSEEATVIKRGEAQLRGGKGTAWEEVKQRLEL